MQQISFSIPPSLWAGNPANLSDKTRARYRREIRKLATKKWRDIKREHSLPFLNKFTIEITAVSPYTPYMNPIECEESVKSLIDSAIGILWEDDDSSRRIQTSYQNSDTVSDDGKYQIIMNIYNQDDENDHEKYLSQNHNRSLNREITYKTTIANNMLITSNVSNYKIITRGFADRNEISDSSDARKALIKELSNHIKSELKTKASRFQIQTYHGPISNITARISYPISSVADPDNNLETIAIIRQCMIDMGIIDDSDFIKYTINRDPTPSFIDLETNMPHTTITMYIEK